jgi:hypothetical protein
VKRGKLLKKQDFPTPSRALWRLAYEGMISWRRVAKSRHTQVLAAATVKCSRSVVEKQHSLQRGNAAAPGTQIQ